MVMFVGWNWLFFGRKKFVVFWLGLIVVVVVVVCVGKVVGRVRG